MIKRFFRKFRTNVQDITDNELQDIKNSEILKGELEHINKILLEKEKLNGNLLLLVTSGIGYLTYKVLVNIPLLYELENKELIMQHGIEIISITIFIYIANNQLPEVINRNKLVNRKKLILDLLKENEKLKNIM